MSASTRGAHSLLMHLDREHRAEKDVPDQKDDATMRRRARVSVAEVVNDDRAFAQDGIGEKRRDAASVSIITRGRE